MLRNVCQVLVHYGHQIVGVPSKPWGTDSALGSASSSDKSPESIQVANLDQAR
jgi:hypothetical protein